VPNVTIANDLDALIAPKPLGPRTKRAPK